MGAEMSEHWKCGQPVTYPPKVFRLWRFALVWHGWKHDRWPRFFKTWFWPEDHPKGSVLFREDLRRARTNAVGFECGLLDIRFVVHARRKT